MEANLGNITYSIYTYIEYAAIIPLPMPPRSRLSLAKTDIIRVMGEAPKRVWSYDELGLLMRRNEESWRLAKSQSVRGFVEYLVNETELKPATIRFPKRVCQRYLWGEPSIFEVALSLKNGAYLSHYAAVAWHGLTDQVPKTLYIKIETLNPPVRDGLDQERIHESFLRPQRRSNMVTEFWGYRICLLHGSQTDGAGIEQMPDESGARLRVTGIERTLIDIAVRPSYSGGPAEVLRAYERAQPRVSVNTMAALLKRLNFAYPYHQVIGYYLERAGVYSDEQLDLFRRIPIEFDFYLDYAMKGPKYVQKWRLFVPQGF